MLRIEYTVPYFNPTKMFAPACDLVSKIGSGIYHFIVDRISTLKVKYLNGRVEFLVVPELISGLEEKFNKLKSNPLKENEASKALTDICNLNIATKSLKKLEQAMVKEKIVQFQSILSDAAPFDGKTLIEEALKKF